MKINVGSLSFSSAAVASACFLGACSSSKEKEIPELLPGFTTLPNIVFISIDDMNDWVGAWGGPAITPNIDKLANEGRMFINSYCVAPMSNPSRVSLMTGQRPETTLQYTNQGNFRDRPGGAERLTLPQFLQQHNYRTVAAGKLFHLPRGTGDVPIELSDDISWNYQWKGAMGTPGNELFLDENGNAKWLEGIDLEYLEEFIAPYLRRTGIWGAIPNPREECGDWQIMNFGAEFIQQEHEDPFFLALGVYRPHAPHIVPKEYLDMYPLDKISPPFVPDNEMDDIPELVKRNWTTPFTELVKQQGQWEKAIQGYLASLSFADDCVGHFMDALNQSKYSDNTIVILFSDHSFQLGHKDRWEKYSLWGQATRSPMIIRLPEGMIDPGITQTPVSLLDIFPTVVDLLEIDQPDFLDGNSLVPLLIDSKADWEQPAIVTFEPHNHSILFENWNYIRYKDGSEELYNRRLDPKEWNNLAMDPTLRYMMDSLAKWVPVTPDVEDYYWFSTHYGERAPGHRR